MFERRHEPLLPRSRFALRVLGFLAAAAAIDCLAVAVGAVGYRALEGFSWLDAVANAAMVITGNGPINELRTPGGRIFATFDALLGEAVYVVVVGVLLTPVFHRFLHWFHLKVEAAEQGTK
jgi:hypothetical protein